MAGLRNTVTQLIEPQCTENKMMPKLAPRVNFEHKKICCFLLKSNYCYHNIVHKFYHKVPIYR